MKEALKLVGALTLVCMACAFLVAAAHAFTAAPIKAAAERRAKDALRAVLPSAPEGGAEAEMERKQIAIGGVTNEYFETAAGYALRATAKGYAGDIALTLGFAKGEEGGAVEFWSYSVDSHSETPGLGAHITDKFVKNVEKRGAFTTNWKVDKDGGDITPITAATISSRAVANAIARGAEIVKAITQEDRE